MNDATKTWIKGATMLATVGVAGFVVYKLYQAYMGRRMLPSSSNVVDVTKPSGPEIVALQLPQVNPGENLSTKTEYVITTKNPSYKYAKILREYKDSSGQTVYDFKSPIHGFFTDKLLSLNGKLYAEIRPT